MSQDFSEGKFVFLIRLDNKVTQDKSLVFKEKNEKVSKKSLSHSGYERKMDQWIPKVSSNPSRIGEIIKCWKKSNNNF